MPWVKVTYVCVADRDGAVRVGPLMATGRLARPGADAAEDPRKDVVLLVAFSVLWFGW